MAKSRVTKVNPLSPLDKLRMGAPAKSRLSVSRPAKRVIRPVTYSGTGNVPKYVRDAVSDLPGYADNIPALRGLVHRVETYAFKHNNGIIPSVEKVRTIAGAGINNRKHP